MCEQNLVDATGQSHHQGELDQVEAVHLRAEQRDQLRAAEHVAVARLGPERAELPLRLLSQDRAGDDVAVRDGDVHGLDAEGHVSFVLGRFPQWLPSSCDNTNYFYVVSGLYQIHQIIL